MRPFLVLLLSFLLIHPTYAQTVFGPRVFIDSFAHDAQQVSSGDFDGDGDLDAVAIMRDEHRVSWYENTDGQGGFGPEQIIATVSFGKSVFVADFDGDGDLDIASGGAINVFWHENDGNGNFLTTHTITASANGAESLFAADFDGDNDIDLASVSSGADKLCWYENLGGGNFSGQIIISTAPDYGEGVYGADFDGDNDIDLVAASYLDDEVSWYENLGNGNWGTAQVISNTADGAIDVWAGDLDGDNDADVLVAAWWANQVLWYENINGQGNFAAAQVLSSGTPQRPYTVFAGDIDHDGDVDIAAGWLYEVGWFENLNGSGSFSSYIQVDYTINDAHRVELADLDSDNDLDILVSTTGSDYVAWYENNPCVNVSDTLFPIVCDTYTVPSGARALVSSGFYTDTLTNAQNCDSIVRIQLTVLHSSSAQYTVTACDSYHSPSGKTWTQSGTYQDTIPNAVGCDSLLTIALIVYPSTASNLNISACNSYLSPSGQLLTSSGIYQDTIANAKGCDSAITIDLQLYFDQSAVWNIIACKQYISPSGQVWTQSGTYNDTLLTQAGCDSAVWINLVVNQVEDSVYLSGAAIQAVATADHYQWLDCQLNYVPIAGANNWSFTPIVNGSYAVQITQNGCVDTSACIVMGSVSTADWSRPKQSLLYPNPNRGTFTIVFGSAVQTAVVRIFNVYGQIVGHQTHHGGREMQWRSLALPAGKYFVEIRDAEGYIETLSCFIE